MTLEILQSSDKLTCCTDWPKTKKGGPPGAQSTIFNPLLACVLGEIPGFCNSQQVAYAIAWWEAVFPCYRKWIAELRAAGLTRDSINGKKLLSSATFLKKSKNNGQRSNTNNLISKLPKHIYGEVPHFKGRAQNEALELAPMVAIEVYACVTCLYHSDQLL